jgi:SPP1 gp7 family putative phage head morphogenesis protein
MWGAHQVDGRISAKNAVKIRAALRQSIDARQVYEMYKATSPAVSDNNAQDRARARAWAIMNVRFINEALRTALMRLFAEAWVTGEAAAVEAIFEEEALRKAGEIGAIDWSKWQPGDKATALLLEPTGAFKRILDKTGTTITGLDKTGYELVGTALADSIRAGYSPRKAAKLIQDAVGSPARALTIAVTESSRVMNSAAIDRYQEAGIETVQWMAVQGGGTSVACEKCAENAGEKRKIGQPFTTGVLQPPQHPHCRCNLRPVVPDYDDMFDEQGNLLPLKPNNNGVSDIMPSRPITSEMKEAIEEYAAGGYTRINGTLRGLTEEQMRTVNWTDRLRARIPQEIKSLDEVIASAPRLKEELVTYRGVQGELAETLSGLQAGDEYTDLAFMSTSKNPKVAEAFAFGKNGKVIKIINPEGTQGLDMTDFIDDPEYEAEWVLPRGSKLRIISVLDNVITAEVVL